MKLEQKLGFVAGSIGFAIRNSRGGALRTDHGRSSLAVWRLVTLLLASILILPPSFATSSSVPLRFERSGIETLLPQSSVNAIHEDSDGFLWFGTREGLARWNGYEMTTWKVDPFNVESLPGNIVRDILEDRHRNLWVTTGMDAAPNVHLSRLREPSRDSVERWDLPGNGLFLGNDGEAAVAHREGIDRFDATTASFARFFQWPDTLWNDENAHPSCAVEDVAGNLWVGWTNGALVCIDPTRAALRFVPDENGWIGATEIRTLLAGADGTIWIGAPAGFGRVAPGTSRSEAIGVHHEDASSWGVGSLVTGTDGQIWVAAADGLHRWDPVRETVQHFELPLLGDSPFRNIPADVLVDRAGVTWAGSVWGLYRWNPEGKEFHHLEHDPRDPGSLGSGLVISLLEDKDEAIWVGTIGGGLNRIDPQTGEAHRFRNEPGRVESLPDDWIWALAEDEMNRLWVAMQSGIAIRDGESGGFRRIPLEGTTRFRETGTSTSADTSVSKSTSELAPTPTSESESASTSVSAPTSAPPSTSESAPTSAPTSTTTVVLSLASDGTGGMWVGAGELLRVQADGRVERGFHQGPLSIEYILPDQDGSVWIGSNQGLMRIDPHTGEQQEYRHDPTDTTSLASDGVLCLHRDRSGALWVGTYSGLCRLDPSTDAFTTFGEADGLPGAVVYGILEPSDDQLWVSTSRGISHLDFSRGPEPRIRNFDSTNGIQNLEFNRSAALRTRDGTLWFGGDRGVTRFDPDRIRENRYRPPVFITALTRTTSRGFEIERNLLSGPVRILPDVHGFSFEFVALNYTNPNRNRYAVKLEGFDPDWIPLGTRRRATWTNVPAGQFVFRVRASNDDGLWNEEGTSLVVEILPPFWRTWWFRALCLLTILALVVGGTWLASHRTYRKRLRAERARQVLERERTRISRDMHDEIGANLTEIAILSELAQMRSKPTAAENDSLSRIAGKSRETLDSIGEIIWAVDPRHDRLGDLASYLREYASEYLEPTSIEVQFNFPDDVVEDVPISAEFRRNVFLVQKEILHNALKHSGAGVVRLKLEITPDRIVLDIADDGCGFDPTAERSGHGLTNLGARAREIGGTLEIGSAPGHGTRVTLSAPLGTLGRSG